MATDRHVGRGTPPFVVEGNPDNFINLINRHGGACRLMQSRKCPCGAKTGTGSPTRFCKLCRGDGYIYNFQRKLLQSDEDSDVRQNRRVILPFRVPIIDVQSVERLLPEEQGDIISYPIRNFSKDRIVIDGEILPRYSEKLRVNYFFDRFTYVKNEIVDVETATKTLITKGTVLDGKHRFGNFKQLHGDITIVDSIVNKDEFSYENFTFVKNRIEIGSGQPILIPGEIKVSYWYAPLTFILPQDLDSTIQKDKWDMMLSEGTVRFGTEPWYNLSDGDLITVMISDIFRDETISHSAGGVDSLNEFDISTINDLIIDAKGVQYKRGSDYVIQGFRKLKWIGNQPNAREVYSVKYSYHPTFKIFQNNVIPNNLENKQYPNVFYAKFFNMTLPKDIERQKENKYSDLNLDFTPL